jgi:hypothetical protein
MRIGPKQLDTTGASNGWVLTYDPALGQYAPAASGGGGAVTHAVTAITVADTPYSATSSDYMVAVTTTLGACTVILPTAATGRTFVIKDMGAAGTNSVTITPAFGQTIDGAANLVISENYQSYTVTGITGTGWAIV